MPRMKRTKNNSKTSSWGAPNRQCAHLWTVMHKFECTEAFWFPYLDVSIDSKPPLCLLKPGAPSQHMFLRQENIVGNLGGINTVRIYW